MSNTFENSQNANTGLSQEDLILQIKYYFALLKSYYKQIFSFSAVCSLAAILYTLTLTPIYQATTTIHIEPLQSKTVSVEEIVRVDRTRRSYYKTQYDVLRSRKLAGMVAEDLKLYEHTLFNPEGQKKELVERGIIGALAGNLVVTPLIGTQLVNVSFYSSDPQLAADVANAYFQAYVENHLESQLAATEKAQSWLSDRLSKLKLKLEESERQLQLYTERENLVDVKGVKSISVGQLEQLNAQLIEVRRKKASAQNNYDQLLSLSKQPDANVTEELLSVSTILSQPIIQELKSQESKLELKIAELSQRYGPKHPKMIAARSELKRLKKNQVLQVNNLIGTFEKELQIVSEMEQSVLQQIEGSNTEIKRINNKSFELAKLIREVEVNKELYDLFLTREKETLGISGFEAPHAKVIDKAIVPRSPVAPQKRLIVSTTFILTLTLACLLIILYDFLDNTVKIPSDVESKLKTNLLGIIPLMDLTTANSSEVDAYKGFMQDKASSFAEALRTIRTGLLLSALDEDKRIIVVSSSLPGEGKSTLSSNLAATLGQMERTLVIDADLRRPSMAKSFDLSSDTKGLSSIISGESTFEECVVKDLTEGVDLLIAGVIPPNPLELLSSRQFKSLIEECKEKYSNIVIDSAPTLSVSDSLVLAQLANLFIYVVKADDTNATAARRGLDRLKHAGAKLAGVVLNQVDIENNAYYGSDYSGYYHSTPYSDEAYKS